MWRRSWRPSAAGCLTQAEPAKARRIAARRTWAAQDRRVQEREENRQDRQADTAQSGNAAEWEGLAAALWRPGHRIARRVAPTDGRPRRVDDLRASRVGQHRPAGSNNRQDQALSGFLWRPADNE